MSEYYKTDYSRQRLQKKRADRGFVMKMIDGILVAVSFVVAAVMLLTFFVPYVNPGAMWFFPELGLAAPASYLSTVLLTLYWVIRWRWGYAGMMLTLVLLGLFNVSLFYKFDPRRDYGQPSFDRSAFQVMTYNVRSFYGANGQNSSGKVLQYILHTDPDVICLQEFNARLAEKSELLQLLDERYESAVFGRTQAPDSLYGAPLVIYSKFRILRSGQVLTPRESVWADVLMGDDTVRVFNNHLRSTALKADDDDFITNHRYLSDSAREDKIRSIVRRLRANSALRAAQVDSIATVVAATPTRKIICGDFNDTPMSYVYRTMADGMQDAFRECGSGFSHTFRGFFNTLRIDYVLNSEGLEPLFYETSELDFSDHHPVLVRMRKTEIATKSE